MTTPALGSQQPQAPGLVMLIVRVGQQPPRMMSRILKILGGIFVALLPLFLFLFSSTIAGHQHDHDVKQQMVESISTAASDASSYAYETGTGEIRHEATTK